MEWLFRRQKRGPEWKQGWTGQAVSSMALPPPPLLTIFAIVVLFLSLSKFLDYRAEMQNTLINFQLFLFLLPVILIFVVRSLSVNGRFVFRLPRPQLHGLIHRGGTSFPWGVAVLVVVLLVMISYQSSVHSQWFRPLWRSY